jgi:acetyl-CoA carboxylase biotin carboxyl carrier protein
VSRPRLELVALDAAAGGVELRCPGPGRVRWDRGPGEVLVGGSVVGTLVRDERAYVLAVPAGVRGAVVSVALAHQWNPCGHGDLLATLSTAIADGDGHAAQSVGAGLRAGPNRPSHAAGAGADARAAAADGVWEVRSPTHGTFYTRPAPGAAPYAAAGSVVESGQTVGLVEVMKCFSPILFDGAPFGRGIVREVLVGDGAEVRADQLLLRIAAS